MPPKDTVLWCDGEKVTEPHRTALHTASLSLQYWKDSVSSIQLKINKWGYAQSLSLSQILNQKKTHQLLKMYQRLTLKSTSTVYIHQAKGHILNSKK